MGFVELPESVSLAEPRGAAGHPRRVSVNVFVGEVVEARALPEHSVLVLDHDTRPQSFDLDVLTIDLRPNDLAAVASISPRKRKSGPIIAIANLDRDQKEEFIGREREILRHVGGWRRDLRKPAALWRAAGWGAAKAVALAGGLWFALALILEERIAASPQVSELAFKLADSGAPILLGALALPYFAAAAALRTRSRARAQKAFLNEIWSAIGASLAYARQASQPVHAPQPAPAIADETWRLGGVDLDYARAV